MIIIQRQFKKYKNKILNMNVTKFFESAQFILYTFTLQQHYTLIEQKVIL